MRDLFDPAVRAELIARLKRLDPASAPRWGSLDPAGLLAHLIDSFRISFNEQPVEVQPGFFTTALGRWLVFHLPIPRGRIKAPAPFHETSPGDFEADRAAVIAAIERFAAGPDQDWGVSPFMGPMSGRDWARLHAKHLDHHLKQFGV